MRKFIYFLFAIKAFSHPHFFISNNLEIKEQYIKSSWKFDLINSKILIFQFDENKNNLFENKEKEKFLNTHFFTLKENNYNLFLQLDDEEIASINLEDIDVLIQNQKINILFKIKIHDFKTMTFCTIDPKIYMAYRLNKINTNFEIETEKSEYDFCIGVKNEKSID